MKHISIGVALAVMFVGQSAFAQAYYPAPQNYQYSSCTQINRDLSVGSKGSDVLSLQRFIVSRNYPGGGAWMLTSYYGAATRAGVINFQIDQRLPQTGILDAQTRAALSSVTCGYASMPITQPVTYGPWYNFNSYSYGYNYNNNCSLVYGANCQCSGGQGWYAVNGSYYNCQNNFNYNNTISISYLSPSSGPIGTNVTIYGGGFTAQNNSIKFGSGIIAGLPSYDGRSISFVVPSVLTGYGTNLVSAGSYYVVVTNANGQTSNSVPFTVSGGSVSNNAPTISNISGPNRLNMNTAGTWQVSVNNPTSYSSVSVNWGDPVYGAYAQAPQQINGNGQQTVSFTHSYASVGTYTVTFTVSNSNGSNTSSATVVVSDSNNPMITSVTPVSGSVGTVIQITGSGFTGDNTVHFGIGGKSHVTSMSGNYIYFTVPSSLSPCDVQVSGTYCAQYLVPVSSGQYQIYVTANGVNSNSVIFTVQ